MDIRSPLNQCIALSLAGILFLNPIVAAAAGLALDKAPGLGQAGNGVPSSISPRPTAPGCRTTISATTTSAPTG
ncbi:hypothetical protein BANRA_06071 [Pseudomonas aeruginosa]|nr:hypothetical protein BANRA_06071 [Pseudomonas aeruginosa]